MSLTTLVNEISDKRLHFNTDKNFKDCYKHVACFIKCCEKCG